MRACLFLFAAAAAFAQTGAISGTILDEFGVPVADAAVTAKAASGAEFKAVASASGEYAIEQLAPGTYEVQVTALAMRQFTKKDVAVAPREPAKLDVSLVAARNQGTLGDGDRFTVASWRRGGKDPPAGPAPRLADGKPDLSGYWVDPIDPADPSAPREAQPDALPWADQIRKERLTSNLRDLPSARCLPNSLIEWPPFAKFIYTPGYLLMLTFGEPARQVFLDGRGHPNDVQPTWLGHSIGKWDGDTLVIDTVGFNGLAWWSGGLPATEQMHIVERYRRVDLGHLEVEETVEDPPVLRTPWTKKSVLNLDPRGEMEEYVCAENNKDPEHMVGK